MAAVNPPVQPIVTSADKEANALLARAANGKPGVKKLTSNGSVARGVAGTKVSGRGATKTRGGSL